MMNLDYISGGNFRQHFMVKAAEELGLKYEMKLKYISEREIIGGIPKCKFIYHKKTVEVKFKGIEKSVHFTKVPNLKKCIDWFPTFWKIKEADWDEVTVENATNVEKHLFFRNSPADLIPYHIKTPSGTIYYFDLMNNHTIYRISDHWGANMDGCNWYIKGYPGVDSYEWKKLKLGIKIAKISMINCVL